jgi:hypothetical protein
MTAALRVLADCDVAAVGARFHCGLKLHATGTLSLSVDAVNDPHDDGAERGGGVAEDLAGGVAFIDYKHAFTDAGPDAVGNGDEVAGVNLAEKDYYRWIFANEPDWEEFR